MMRSTNRIYVGVLGILVLACGRAGLAQQRVSEGVHNLSVSGGGVIRAESEQQVCIFCHAPHNTGGMTPLWNRELPSASYTIYQSSTLDAQPGQPTGSSKLCLSCHDGTIALGNVLSRADQIRMAGGDTIPAGLTNLGTDLSDDHPISFAYTSGLAASDQQLAHPAGLNPAVKLDASGALQCTSCHDPHNNMFGDFLVMSNEFGALCTVCHVMNGWSAGSHSLSNAGVSGSQSGDWPYPTVSQNACRSCHRPHTAGGHERLLIAENDEDNCLSCHDGLVAGTNIRTVLNRTSAHDPRNYHGIHDPVEQAAGTADHVECADCHNPHAATAQGPTTGYIPIGATLAGVPGVTAGGAYLAAAQYEYEVCFRCHGDSAVQVSGRIVRQVQTTNLRLKFNQTNPSFHPVVASSPSPDTVSLIPGLARGARLRCTDCHNNDSGPRAGGAGPDGPHGSTYDFLLEKNYNVRDDVTEAEFEYALCYKCHLRSSILGDDSFRKHKKHIEKERTPCSACHDPHGVTLALGSSSDHTHLINFDTQIVLPEPSTGRREFRDDGTLAGRCTLLCHGKKHRDQRYRQ